MTRWNRALSGFGGFVSGCAMALLLVGWTMNRLGMAPSWIALDVRTEVDKWKQAYADAAPSRSPVALTGDSLVMVPPDVAAAGILALPEQLDLEIHRLAPERQIDIVPLRWGGYGQLENYFLADEIAAAGTQRIVVALNLRSVGTAWTDRWTRTELAGSIAPSRLPSALALPLHRVGLTANRLLLYAVFGHVIGYRGWRWFAQQQNRVTLLPGRLSTLVDRYTGLDAGKRYDLALLRERARGERQRGTAAGVRREYGAVLSGVEPGDFFPTLLTRTLRVWQKAGIQVLVVVMPVNLEHWQAVGVLDDGSGLARSIDTIRQAVHDGGGSFLDLHDLLGRAGFRDAAGHLTHEGGVDGIARAVARMAPAVLDAFEPPTAKP